MIQLMLVLMLLLIDVVNDATAVAAKDDVARMRMMRNSVGISKWFREFFGRAVVPHYFHSSNLSAITIMRMIIWHA